MGNSSSSRPARKPKAAPAAQALPPAASEAAFMEAVVELATLRGWRCWHDYDSRRNAAGLPDLILVRGDRLLFAELKTQRGRIRPEQLDWLSALCQTAAEVYLWRPGDWQEIEKALMA